jgi:hypothetical protein
MISAGKRPQTYVLDRAATGTGKAIVVTAQKQEKENLIIIKMSFLVMLLIYSSYLQYAKDANYSGGG